MNRLIAIILVTALALSGCATMRYPSTYKVDGKQCWSFKELDDEQALKIVALIYNMPHQAKDDDVARSLALEQYLALVKKRNSKLIKESGIFNIEYNKVNLSKWSEDDLVGLLDSLEPKVQGSAVEGVQTLSESQNTQRIVYLTAAYCVGNELQKRDQTRQALSIAGQVLTTALSVALSMI